MREVRCGRTREPRLSAQARVTYASHCACLVSPPARRGYGAGVQAISTSQNYAAAMATVLYRGLVKARWIAARIFGGEEEPFTKLFNAYLQLNAEMFERRTQEGQK